MYLSIEFALFDEAGSTKISAAERPILSGCGRSRWLSRQSSPQSRSTIIRSIQRPDWGVMRTNSLSAIAAQAGARPRAVTPRPKNFPAKPKGPCASLNRGSAGRWRQQS